MTTIDLTNNKFGRLSVRKRAPDRINTSGCRYPMWDCVCECGKEKIVRGDHLRTGRVASCGCLFRDIIVERNTTHGLCHHPIYGIWKKMKNRTSNPNNPKFGDYGGRGITVCKEWENDFPKFLNDMGERPSEAHSIERRNNDRGYCRENCYWATASQQANNKRSSRLITANGKTMTLHQWSLESGIKRGTILARIEGGWNSEDAINKRVLLSHESRSSHRVDPHERDTGTVIEP